MELVIASVQLQEGNVLSFKLFPTPPYPLSFVVTFHAVGEVSADIAYRVRKWDQVICETQPAPLHAPASAEKETVARAASIEVVFPSQGGYLLDVLSGGAVLYSVPFSVFDSSKRTDLESEIVYYLKAKRGPRSVEEITRAVYNPAILSRANFAEITGRVYFALLRMSEVINTNPVDRGNLADKMKNSRWRLK